MKNDDGKIVRVNAVKIWLPIDQNATVEVKFQAFEPASTVKHYGQFSFGRNVRKIQEGIYLTSWYGAGDTRQLQSAVKLIPNHYILIVTRLEAVNEPIYGFSLSELAQFKLADVVRKSLQEEMTSAWEYYVVEEFPSSDDLKEEDFAFHQVVDITDTVFLVIHSNIVGEIKHVVFALKSEWADLD